MTMIEGARLMDVLLVEDGETDALMVQEAFSEAKLANRLHVVTSGEEAFDFLNKSSGHERAPTPDLILLDLNLPGMSGQDVLARMKKNAAYGLIPVVVLTTSKAEEDVCMAYELHCNCYVTKPVGFEKLKDAVQAIQDFWLGLAILPPVRA